MQVRSEWLQMDAEIHGRAETRVAVATLVRSAHPLPHEDAIRSVEGPDARTRSRVHALPESGPEPPRPGGFAGGMNTSCYISGGAGYPTRYVIFPGTDGARFSPTSQT